MAQKQKPKKDISDELVFDLAKIQCTMEEIAAMCKCSVDTLERRFADTIRIGKLAGKESLRRSQFKNAWAGNTSMQQWLGKQYLDQADKVISLNKNENRNTEEVSALAKQILEATSCAKASKE